MRNPDTLLLINHTASVLEVADYKDEAEKRGWVVTSLHFSAVKEAEKEFNAVVLLGLSVGAEKGLNLVYQIRECWPKALLYVITHHENHRILDACRVLGVKEIFNPMQRAQHIMSSIKKPPES